MDEMRLNHEQKTLAKQFFNKGKMANFNLSRILTLLQEACRDNAELLKLFMDIQYRAAQTDGLSDMKLQALDVVFRQMGFTPLHQQYRFYEDFGYQNSQQSTNQRSYSRQNNHSYQAPLNTLMQAYAILEVKPTANKQEVKAAYRRLTSRNHPDKLIAQGLPEEMIKIANDKTQKIRKAYEQICASKGW
jgi:DnaJ like chaperone protein